MNTFYKFLACFAIFLSLFSCKAEENEAFTSFDTNAAIQNDGYLPLAVDNNWVYENRLAIINDNGTYEYSGEVVESEHPVSNVKFRTNNKTDVKSIDYGFTPLGLGKVLGGFFGNFIQITKIGKDYYRKNIILKDSLVRGRIEKKYLYELADQKFLTDDVTPGLIGSKRDTLIGDGKKGLLIDYEVNSYVVEVLTDGLPPNLRNQPGIDKHLEVYKDVLHTRDVITIKSLESISEGGVRLRLNAEVEIPAGTSKLETRSVGPSELNGRIFMGGVGVVVVPIIAIGNFTGPPEDDEEPLISDLKLAPNVCPARATINIDEVMEGSKMVFVSDQPIYTIDQYWVRGVGNIKNITSPAKFKAIIDLKGSEKLSAPLKLEPIKSQNPSIPECKDIRNTATLNMSLQSQPAVGYIEIPLTLESRSYVQNLKSVRLRTTNN